MVDLIFGRSFWSMVWRFALFPVVLNIIALPFLFLVPENPSHVALELSFLSKIYLLFFEMIFWSWLGWGLAFWRFDRRDIPVQSFVAYPFFSGFTVVPIYWILLASSPDSGTDDLISATVFGMVVGPLMAIIMTTFWRYAPQATSPGKKNPS